MYEDKNSILFFKFMVYLTSQIEKPNLVLQEKNKLFYEIQYDFMTLETKLRLLGNYYN